MTEFYTHAFRSQLHGPRDIVSRRNTLIVLSQMANSMINYRAGDITPDLPGYACGVAAGSGLERPHVHIP